MSETPIIEGAGPLLTRYEVLLCDVWGVLHNGVSAFAEAGAALARFRAAGGTVILLSNAPQPRSRVAEILDERGVRRDAYDAIISSGDLALAHIRGSGFERLHRIGPMPRSTPFFSILPGSPADIGTADAIVCTGLANDLTETAETYRALLNEARARDLPFVCANPDLVVDVGGRLYLCAGAIAALYEELGGAVAWTGKPHAPAYEAAFAEANRLRGGRVARSSVLAIGDAMRTDIAGAAGTGIDSLFVAHGIHAAETMREHRIDPDGLARLIEASELRPKAAIDALRW